MVDLIFLGMIPGTHLQVTFGTWLYCTGVLLVLFGIYYLIARRNVLGRLRAYVALRIVLWQFSHQALLA